MAHISPVLLLARIDRQDLEPESRTRNNSAVHIRVLRTGDLSTGVMLASLKSPVQSPTATAASVADSVLPVAKRPRPAAGP